MQFEWDAQKAQKVWEKHGIKFTDAAMVFTVKRIEERTNFASEPRWITVGEVDGRLMAIVYTMRGEVIGLITARRVRKNEERQYRSYIS
jgi:uncharacterized protein